MSLDIRCDECRKHLDSGDEIVCRICLDAKVDEASRTAADEAFDRGRDEGYKAGYEDGKTAQIFGDEPGAPKTGEA